MQELNDVLHFIANSDFKIAANPSKYIFDQFAKGNKMEYAVFAKVLRKLVRDGYMEQVEIRERNEYLLTYEGYLFDQQGGYVQLEKDKSKAANLQSLQTWVISVGTGLAGIYGLYELIKAIFHL